MPNQKIQIGYDNVTFDYYRSFQLVPNTDWLVTPSNYHNRELSFWNWKTGLEIGKVKIPESYDVAVSPNGELLALTSQGADLRILKTADVLKITFEKFLTQNGMLR